MSGLYCRTIRQHRAILALSNGNMTSKDLQKIVGVLNAPQLISELRGFGWEIVCKKVPVLDQDKRKCYRGVYSISEDMRKMAKIVSKWDDAEPVRAGATSNITNVLKKDNSRGAKV